jgi:hypothetical protein
MICAGKSLACLILGIALMPRVALTQIFITNLNRMVPSVPSIFSVKTNAPAGQSFRAVTNAIGWVDFFLDDANPSNDIPARLHVNLREYDEVDKSGFPTPITGAVIASSYSITLTNGHLTGGRSNETRFIFPTNIPLVMPTKYWCELVWESGDDILVRYYHLGYPDGDAITNGIKFSTDPYSTWDMGFKIGTIAQYPQFTNVRLTRTETNLYLDGFVDGLNGAECRVEYSYDLVTWTPLYSPSAWTFPLNMHSLIETGSNSAPAKFWRVRYLNER